MTTSLRLTSSALCACLLVFALLPGGARAESDPLAEAQAAHDLGEALLDAGTALEDADRIRGALAKFQEAASQYRARLDPGARPPARAGLRSRLERQLEQAEARIAFCREYLDLLALGGGRGAPSPEPGTGATPDGPAASPPPTEPPAEAPAPEVVLPERKRRHAFGRWVRKVEGMVRDEPSPETRAALARAIGAEAGLVGLPALVRMFRRETAGAAREGVHEALAQVGTSRVARRMASFAVRGREARWSDALDVIYRCLEKSETEEPERPFLLAVRRFHELEDKALTLSILTRLDEMGTPGTAALGQVLYVADFGYHDHAISLLATKRDGRAVPPLIFKMNRFKFEYRVQMPAHHALLRIGWYAVPALIDHLDDKAAGIWISWTLRKITGETTGTQKRKWHEWWKTEKVRHPELFVTPEERPPSTPSTGPGQPHGVGS